MTSPNSSSQTIEADSAAAEPLRALRRGLVRADGFALYIAVVNTPAQRNQLITLLGEAMPGVKLQTVTIGKETTDILVEIRQQLGETISGPVMVVGLEDVLSSDTQSHSILNSLNLRRPDWPQLIPQPVVFWLPEYLLGLFARSAPDFLDWRSDTLHFPELEPAQLQALHSDAAWDRGMDTQMPADAKIERIKELESRIITNQHSHDPVILATVADWLNELGLHFELLGKIRKALDCFQKALSITHKIGNPKLEGVSLGNLGIAYGHLGKIDKAIELQEQSLVISREIGNRQGEGADLGNLGVLYGQLGDMRKAVKYLEQRLVIAREIGDRRGEENALNNLGNVNFYLGNMREAIEFYKQALKIAQKNGNRRGEASALANLGSLHQQLGDVHMAIQFYEQSLLIDREIGNRQGEGSVINNLGNAYYSLGNGRRAIELCEQALIIHREIGDRHGENAALGTLGNIYAAMGDAPKAIQFYEQSSMIAREIGDRRHEGIGLWNSADELWKTNNRAQAIARAEAALKLLEAVEDPLRTQVRAKLAEWRAAKQ